MIETSETFDLAVVLEHRGRLGHGASAVGGERPGIRATGHLGQGAVAYRRQRERQHHSTIPRGHRGLRPVPSQADASHRGWRSSRSAAMATCRMAAFRPAALPCERGMWCEERGHSQVPHRRLAMVLAARGDGRTHSRIHEEQRQAHQPSLLLHRRAYRNHGRTMGLPPCRMEPCQRTH